MRYNDFKSTSPASPARALVPCATPRSPANAFALYPMGLMSTKWVSLSLVLVVSIWADPLLGTCYGFDTRIVAIWSDQPIFFAQLSYCFCSTIGLSQCHWGRYALISFCSRIYSGNFC